MDSFGSAERGWAPPLVWRFYKERRKNLLKGRQGSFQDRVNFGPCSSSEFTGSFTDSLPR